MKTATERLADSIGYPERVPDGALSFTLRVDGAEIYAEESDGRMTLTYVLSDDESLLPSLARYAAGRMLKEDATLSFGLPRLSASGFRPSTATPDLRPSTFLWQDAPADADVHALRRLFETFADSCDWWRARLEQRSGDDRPSPFPEVMIRP